WPDDIPREEKNRRLHELSKELATSSSAYNRRMIGGTYRVLVEGPDRKPGYLSAKTEGRITVRFQSEERALIGQFVDVTITSAAALSVQGELAAVPAAHCSWSAFTRDATLASR